MMLSDKELLKSVLYDDRHAEANALLDEDEQQRLEATQNRKQKLQTEKSRRARRKKFLLAATPFAIILLLVGGVIAFDYLSSWGRIHRNVTILDLEVGGKTPEDAKVYLDTRLTEFAEQPVRISFLPEGYDFAENGNAEAGASEESPSSDTEADTDTEELGHHWEIFPAAIGLSFDTTAAVEQAFEFGRSENILDSLRDRFLSYFGPLLVEMHASSDEELATEAFEPLRETINVEPIDSRVTLEDGTFNMVSGSDGVLLNEIELSVLMANAVLERDYQIDAPVEVAIRDIDDENAQRAARAANYAASMPVEVSYNDQHWTFESATIARLLDFKRSDRLDEEDILLHSIEPTPAVDFVLDVLVLPEQVQERIVSTLGADVGTAPVDARFSISGGQVIIHPSEPGSGVDTRQLAYDLAEALVADREGARTVEVVMNEIRPRRTTEDAQEMGIRERISVYTTNFPSGNRPRVNNIQLIARILDGTILAPGEEFSFNGTTGQRTAARGFQEAGAIIRGEMSTSVGGGICQVSTTLFNATMEAGLHITQRINHSTFLSAYPPGRDATVAWNGPDFRFRNSLDHYIMIATSSTSSSVTISFFGTDPGYTVSIRTGNFNRTNYRTEEVRDNTLPRGRRVVERAGQRGGNVSVFYTVRDGERVVREQTFTSRYRTINEIVRVGTKPPEEAEPDDTDNDNGASNDAVAESNDDD